MLPWIIIAIIATPIAEIAAFIKVGAQWGLWPALGAIFATGIAGSLLIRRQGMALVREVQEEISVGRSPARQVLDRLCLLIGGILLLLPGFITDAIGFVFLIPLVRLFVISGLTGWIKIDAFRVSGTNIDPSRQTINGEFVDVTDHPSPPTGSNPQLPPSG